MAEGPDPVAGPVDGVAEDVGGVGDGEEEALASFFLPLPLAFFGPDDEEGGVEAGFIFLASLPRRHAEKRVNGALGVW